MVVRLWCFRLVRDYITVTIYTQNYRSLAVTKQTEVNILTEILHLAPLAQMAKAFGFII
jgi:hypothetical protein